MKDREDLEMSIVETKMSSELRNKSSKKNTEDGETVSDRECRRENSDRWNQIAQ